MIDKPMKVKEMRLHYQPDVSFDTRYGRYYRTGDPTYIPKKRLYLKKICPAYIPYWCFSMRVRKKWLEKALEMPYKGYHRDRVNKVK